MSAVPDFVAMVRKASANITPRTERVIEQAMREHKGKRYYEEVHQVIAPLCRELEAENRALQAALARLQNPNDETLFEVGNALRDEVQDKAPSPDLPTLRNRYRLAWHRVLAKLYAPEQGDQRG